MNKSLPNKESETKIIYCNHCKCSTHHICKGEDFKEYEDEIVGYKLWVCAGCDDGTMEKLFAFGNDIDEYGQLNYKSDYFPPRNYHFQEAKRFNKLPEKLELVYEEILKAFNNDLNLLCAVGIRTLLEGICADKGIKGRNLEIKIDNMITILPQNIVTNLHAIRFLGNEAAHELTVPPTSELELAIEVCEDLLNYQYELDYKANLLTKMRDERGKRNELPGIDF